MSLPQAPFETVFLDCDSTLVTVEGIDELAERAGVGAEMSRLTNAAMNGEMPLEQVYGQRLAAVRPDAEALNWLADRYVESLVPGAQELAAALQALGKKVHLVSGGLLPGVAAVGMSLEIDPSRVHAVPVVLDHEGRFAGFDRDSPLARTGGKAFVCRRELGTGSGSGTSAIVGDGQTDLEASGICDAVIGFGGVVARPEVRRRADCFIEHPSLFPVLAALLTPSELLQLEAAGHGETVRKARATTGSSHA